MRKWNSKNSELLPIPQPHSSNCDNREEFIVRSDSQISLELQLEKKKKKKRLDSHISGMPLIAICTIRADQMGWRGED